MNNIALYVAAVLIWGSTWFVIKFQLGVVDPVLSVSYRFFIAAGLMFVLALVMGWLRDYRFTRREMAFVALQGCTLFFLNYWLTYSATGYMTSGIVAVCFSLITVMNIFNQRLFFGIPLRPLVVIGSLLGVIGIVCVFWPEMKAVGVGGDAITGMILCVIGTAVASLGNMASYRNSRAGLPIFMTNCYAMGFGALFSLIAALGSGAPLVFDYSFDYIWSLLYLAVFGSVVAFVSYLTLLARIGADRAGYAGVLVPIVALAISTVFEDYQWSLLSAGGVALIIIGNVLALVNFKKGIPTSSLGAVSGSPK